jgi:membrane protease YdiL (CAAX protease family)
VEESVNPPAAAPSRVWRVLQHPLVRGSIGFCWLLGVTVGAYVLLGWVPPDSAWGQLGVAVAVALLSLLAYAAFVRVIERRAPSELALGPAARETALGVGLGALLFSLTVGLLYVFGFYRVSGLNPWTVLVPALTISITSGVVEELIFRGIIFRIAQEGLGTWLALLLSAVIFGALHLANPNATLMAGLAIAIEAGVLLAAVYLVSGRMWAAMGLHFSWNFTQGGIFGVAVSGNEVPGLLESTLVGPPLLSGGSFGAEASIFAVVVCVAAAAVFIAKARREGRIVPMPWGRKTGAEVETGD